MENIQKSIYSRPEIRRMLLPLWSAWILTAVGVVCSVVFFFGGVIFDGSASVLLGGMFVGGGALITVLFYWLFGDSHRPYHRELHSVLEPTYAYYSLSLENQIMAALESGDEQTLTAIRQQTNPDLALIRYHDKDGCIYYSQLTRVEGERFIPLTDIIINDLRQK